MQRQQPMQWPHYMQRQHYAEAAATVACKGSSSCNGHSRCKGSSMQKQQYAEAAVCMGSRVQLHLHGLKPKRGGISKPGHFLQVWHKATLVRQLELSAQCPDGSQPGNVTVSNEGKASVTSQHILLCCIIQCWQACSITAEHVVHSQTHLIANSSRDSLSDNRTAIISHCTEVLHHLVHVLQKQSLVLRQCHSHR